MNSGSPRKVEVLLIIFFLVFLDGYIFIYFIIYNFSIGIFLRSYGYLSFWSSTSVCTSWASFPLPFSSTRIQPSLGLVITGPTNNRRVNLLSNSRLLIVEGSGEHQSGNRGRCRKLSLWYAQESWELKVFSFLRISYLMMQGLELLMESLENRVKSSINWITCQRFFCLHLWGLDIY